MCIYKSLYMQSSERHTTQATSKWSIFMPLLSEMRCYWCSLTSVSKNLAGLQEKQEGELQPVLRRCFLFDNNWGLLNESSVSVWWVCSRAGSITCYGGSQCSSSSGWRQRRRRQRARVGIGSRSSQNFLNGGESRRLNHFFQVGSVLDYSAEIGKAFGCVFDTTDGKTFGFSTIPPSVSLCKREEETCENVHPYTSLSLLIDPQKLIKKEC